MLQRLSFCLRKTLSFRLRVVFRFLNGRILGTETQFPLTETQKFRLRELKNSADGN
jgi:hypothetical protein